MNINQNMASNILLLKSLENQAKASGGASEKTISVEIKSVSPQQNTILLALPNNTTIILEIPPNTAINLPSFSAGDKIEIPLSLIKNALNLQAQIPVQENLAAIIGDKFAPQTPATNDKTAEFSKIIEAVLRTLEVKITDGKEITDDKTAEKTDEKKPPLPPAEKEFTKFFLKEIEQIIRKNPAESPLIQTLPKAENIKSPDEIFKWAATQIKSGYLPARDFFTLPQILFSPAPPPETASGQTQNEINNGRIQYALTPPSTENPVGADIIRPHPEVAENRATTITQPQISQNQTAAAQPHFVQQTATNIKENIQNLIPQFQNESIKAVLNEIIRQISTDVNNSQNAFAFVKIDVKNQDFASFLPLPQQAQFDSEFSALMSKKFPTLPQELFVETANIIRTGEKPLVLSENVLKNLEIILKPIVSEAKTPVLVETQESGRIISAPTATQWKITPSVLANLLNYAAGMNNGETILQNIKTLFANEKSIENVASGIKIFLESFKEISEKPLMQTMQKESPLLISEQFVKSLEKLDVIQNILRTPEMIFKRNDPFDFLFSRTGILQDKSTENSPKIDESLRGVLREISEQVKTAATRLQNLPNLESDEKSTRAFSNLRELANSVNDAARRIDASTLLSNRGEFAQGRSEQTILIPVQIGNSWVQMELRVNKDGRQKSNKTKREASQVEVNVELEKGNSVAAKANLTLEKQLQVSINFTNEKMLEWFKMNYKEFCESLESAGTKSVQVVFNREKKAEKRESADIRKSNFELVG